MQRWSRTALVSVVLAIATTACASPQGSPAAQTSSSNGSPSSPAVGPKRIIAAMMGNPPAPIEKALGGGSGGRIPGITGLQQLVDAFVDSLGKLGERVGRCA